MYCKKGLFKSTSTTSLVTKTSVDLNTKRPKRSYFYSFLVATEYKGSLEREGVFHEHTKTLSAEKFVKAQFLVPYRQFDIQLTKNLDQVATERQNMWRMPTYWCYLNLTNTSENNFKVDWLLRETEIEILFAN